MASLPVLPPERLERIAPALRGIAEEIRAAPTIDREVWKRILYGIRTNEGWALNELQNWAAILRSVRENGDESRRTDARAALTARGVSDAAAQLAVDIAATPRKAPARPATEAAAPVVPSSVPISLDRAAVGFGTLKPGEAAKARIVVTGGPGRVLGNSDLLEVSPAEFGPEGGVLTVQVKGGSPGQLLSCSFTIAQDAAASLVVEVAARWRDPAGSAKRAQFEPPRDTRKPGTGSVLKDPPPPAKTPEGPPKRPPRKPPVFEPQFKSKN